jgi:hypothetical protein
MLKKEHIRDKAMNVARRNKLRALVSKDKKFKDTTRGSLLNHRL